MRHRVVLVTVIAAVLLIVGLVASQLLFKPLQTQTLSQPQTLSAQVTLPRPDHVVIVVEENQASHTIIGSTDAPYINSLATQGALFTNFHAETHPSQPNYLALYSGSTQGLDSDACPNTYTGPNLGASLLNAHFSFSGYSETMPSPGYAGCSAPDDFNALYARKHNPWSNFTNVPASSNQPFTSFPSNYSQLPTVSFVVPNQIHDMHSASVADGDSWLKANLDGYARWATTHNSLLIVTWDEDDGSTTNQIATIFTGAMVKPGQYDQSLNHYNLLRTLTEMYDLSPLNESATAPAIENVWK